MPPLSHHLVLSTLFPSTIPVTLLSAVVKSKGSVSVLNLTSWLQLTVLSTLSLKKMMGLLFLSWKAFFLYMEYFRHKKE